VGGAEGPVARPHVAFVLHGHKLGGRFALTRTGERRWILVKAADDEARPGSDIVVEQPTSVRTGLTVDEMAEGGPPEPR
jgi:bifunctional non-homologous end joining protein LigD